VDCEADFDGCESVPCATGQACTDIPAAQHTATGPAYTCGACPTGSVVTGQKCVGKYCIFFMLVTIKFHVLKSELLVKCVL